MYLLVGTVSQVSDVAHGPLVQHVTFKFWAFNAIYDVTSQLLVQSRQNINTHPYMYTSMQFIKAVNLHKVYFVLSIVKDKTILFKNIFIV